MTPVNLPLNCSHPLTAPIFRLRECEFEDGFSFSSCSSHRTTGKVGLNIPGGASIGVNLEICFRKKLSVDCSKFVFTCMKNLHWACHCKNYWNPLSQRSCLTLSHLVHGSMKLAHSFWWASRAWHVINFISQGNSHCYYPPDSGRGGGGGGGGGGGCANPLTATITIV